MPKNLSPDRIPRARSRKLGPAREETIERLQQAYADDLLTLDELDERLELATAHNAPEGSRNPPALLPTPRPKHFSCYLSQRP